MTRARKEPIFVNPIKLVGDGRHMDMPVARRLISKNGSMLSRQWACTHHKGAKEVLQGKGEWGRYQQEVS